jgi:Domain of unknown function (DUF4365)
MTTKHKLSRSTSNKGVRFVENVVNEKNCIFQEIALENDIGNDAYLEFIQDEQATGCCIAIQIKSGDSYVTSNENFVLRADRDHFEYWHSHVLPIAAIVYSPKKNYAVWCDVTEYLSQHSNIIETGPYSVEIPLSQEFSSKTFDRFRSHFLRYLEPYKHKLDVALEKFAGISNYQNCLDGMNYLFSFQRQNFASWYYIISCFQNFRRHPLLFHLINKIAYLPGHGDIFWHKENIVEDQTRKIALTFLKERFGRIDVLCMLEVVTEGGGFARGAIGLPVEVIVSQLKHREKIIESIAFDSDTNEDSRYWALLLLVFYAQRRDSGIAECLKFVDRYQHQFSNDDSDINDMVSGIREELEMYGRFNIFY